ncbi:MAG: hypothetical protein ABJA78_08735 [Ferruginibacter sp.]
MQKLLFTIVFIMAVSLTHAQNVGIGTNTPLMKLHVSSSDSALLLLTNTTPIAAGVKSAMYFQSGNRFTGAIKAEAVSGTDGRLGFFTFAGTDANTLRERLTIGDNGYIGIGNNNPAAQVHIVQGTLAGLPSLLLEENFDDYARLNLKNITPNNSGNNFWTIAGYNNNNSSLERLNFNNNATGTILSLTGNGNVGIGNSNPSMRLDVAAPDSATLLLRNTNAITAGIKSSIYFEAGNRFTGAIKTEGVSATDARMGFFTFAGTDANTLRERLTIADNGYIGIGNNNPVAQVHVVQGTAGGLTSLLLEENFDNFAKLNMKSTHANNSGNNFWQIASYNHDTRATERLNFVNNASGTLMSLTGNGHLGIGTTTPTAQFEIVTAGGDSSPTARFINNSGSLGSVVEITTAVGAFANGLYSHTNSPGFQGGAIYAVNTGVGGNAIVGEASTDANAWAILGVSTLGEAGHFQGNVNVVGTLSKSAGTFKIDHPMDPANKYLIHSFVESPDMMNVYNGNITTDAKGKAIVTLPSYFEAENIDFKYQLTIVDETKFAMARISKKVSGNKFEIMTDQPNVEVSWQVTGVRNDAYAIAHRIVPEVQKTGKEAGKYIHPELFGQSSDKSVYYKAEIKKADAAVPAEDPSYKLAVVNDGLLLHKKTD